MSDLPQPIAELVDLLAAMPGTAAVVLGGSRALGSNDAASDWDLGVYYRGAIDLTALATCGVVYLPGSSGRVMNGGAWLRYGGEKVDVLLRDLDVVDHWTRRAEIGEFEVDALLGYLAGIPTYSLSAELASCRVLRGDIPAAPPFPPKLIAAAPPRWRGGRSFSLDYARMHARRGNVVGTLGQTAKPWRPFVIHVAGGDSYPCLQPQDLGITKDGKMLFYFDDDGTATRIDAEFVSEITEA